VIWAFIASLLLVCSHQNEHSAASMGKYTAAAHQAARTVEQQSSLLDCRAPANAIVREFLL
jgi:hypothetical protein